MPDVIRTVTNIETGERAFITDVVYSPDDGGYYLHEHDLKNMLSRVSKKVWPTRDKAVSAYQGKPAWEPWS